MATVVASRPALTLQQEQEGDGSFAPPRQSAFVPREPCGDQFLVIATAERAREHVLANFTWDRAAAALRAAYRELGISRSSTAAS